LCKKCILFWITKKVEEAKILFKEQFSGVLLNAILPIIGVRTKPDLALKRLKLERLADSGDELYNVASSTAYW
jgi:hypothetical protein